VRCYSWAASAFSRSVIVKPVQGVPVELNSFRHSLFNVDFSKFLIID